MKNSQREIPNEADGNPFMNFRDLLSQGKVSVATLATAIEDNGVYAWDKYGRFKKFTKDQPENSEALKLLAWLYERDNSSWEDQGQMDGLNQADGPDDPFYKYGWSLEVCPDFKLIRDGQSEIAHKKWNKREYASYLRIIGALLEYIKGDAPGVEKHPSFINEAKLIEFFDSKYEGYEGLSQSNLSRKFPESKRILSNS